MTTETSPTILYQRATENTKQSLRPATAIMGKYDLAIAYRIYPGFNKDQYMLDGWEKYKLSKVCLQSFVDSLSNIDYKFYALLDGCPERYEELFEDIIPDNRLEVHHFPGIGNERMFIKQLQILIEQNDSNAVYFAEDDYLYLNEFSDMLAVLQQERVDFVTPYDHPDYYQIDIEPDKPDRLAGLHDYESEIIFNKRHWRSVSSTTCTFLTSKQMLKETKEYIQLYSDISDYGMWLCLTKKRKRHFDPLRTAQMYLYAGKSILFDRSYSLWSPIPSIATHMDERYLAKGIDWDEVISRYV